MPKVEELVVGDPAEEETDVGPVIDDDARERILSWIEEARDGGAEILAGGDPEGDLIRPTVIANATLGHEGLPRGGLRPGRASSTRTSRSTRRSRSPTARATASRRGSSRPTSGPRCRRPRSLEFGGVTVNEAPTFRADQMPYGGVKDSGNTREGPAYAVRELTEQRVVVIDL